MHEVVRIALQWREIGGAAHVDRDAVRKTRPGERGDALEHQARGSRPQGQRRALREAQQLLRQLAAAARSRDDLVEVGGGLGVGGIGAQHAGVGHDAAEEVVELMRDAARELAERVQAALVKSRDSVEHLLATVRRLARRHTADVEA